MFYCIHVVYFYARYDTHNCPILTQTSRTDDSINWRYANSATQAAAARWDGCKDAETIV